MDAHFYANSFIDRAGERRDDDAWLEERRSRPDSLVVPVRHDCSLVFAGEQPKAAILSVKELGELDSEMSVFLGLDGEDRAYFATEAGGEVTVAPAAAGAEFIDLRRIGPLMGARDAGLLAYARGVTHWHRTHRFCGRCGRPTRSDNGGWLRRCDADGCEQPHFPRTDPAIIVRIVFEDMILLGRQASWPPRWYSVLAGFVEPGETLEDAVRREVAEESGVVVRHVRYVSSQPWPFPSSVMIGFAAAAKEPVLDLTHDELEDACWVTRGQLRDRVGRGELHLPPPQSISRRLIDAWLHSSLSETSL
jgi:NAD+ diphosphatase